MTAASSPTFGPTTTRGSFTGRLSRSAWSVVARSFPTGRLGMAAPRSIHAWAEAVALARRVGRAIAVRHALPVWYYGAAATRPGRPTPRELRRGEYEAARRAAGDARRCARRRARALRSSLGRRPRRRPRRPRR